MASYHHGAIAKLTSGTLQEFRKTLSGSHGPRGHDFGGRTGVVRAMSRHVGDHEGTKEDERR